MLTESSPFGHNKNLQDMSKSYDNSPIPLIQEAWQRFYHDPEAYRVWEEQATAAYLEQ
jgi:hypothetical protein